MIRYMIAIRDNDTQDVSDEGLGCFDTEKAAIAAAFDYMGDDECPAAEVIAVYCIDTETGALETIRTYKYFERVRESESKEREFNEMNGIVDERSAVNVDQSWFL